MPSSRQSASSASLSDPSPTALARGTSSSGDSRFRETARFKASPPNPRLSFPADLQQLDERFPDDQDARHGCAWSES